MNEPHNPEVILKSGENNRRVSFKVLQITKRSKLEYDIYNFLYCPKPQKFIFKTDLYMYLVHYYNAGLS